MSEFRKRCNESEQGRTESFALIVITICGLFLSGGVIAGIVYLLLTFISLVAAGPAFEQPAPVAAGVHIQAEIEEKQASATLEQASQIYRKIAAQQ
jgi:hypothetical protein